MSAPAASVDWSAIRRCVELGVPPKATAEKFGVSYDALRQRASRERWLTPAKVEALRAAQVPATPPPAPVSQPPATTSQSDSSAAVTESLVTGTIAEMGAQLQTTVLSKTLQALKKANLADLPINSWADAKTATEVGLKVAGLESQAGPAVSLVFTGTCDLPPLVEIDATAKPITDNDLL